MTLAKLYRRQIATGKTRESLAAKGNRLTSTIYYIIFKLENLLMLAIYTSLLPQITPRQINQS